jgi:hypothetical protein
MTSISFRTFNPRTFKLHTFRSFMVLTAGAIALGLSAGAANANTVSLNPGFGSIELKGTAGGGTPMRDIAGRSDTSTGGCIGFAGGQPDQVLRLNAGFKDLTVLAQSSADTTLVVKGPGGTWCNDDFQGKNAGLDGQWQAGEYRVWVGTQGRNQSIGYTLRVTQD